MKNALFTKDGEWFLIPELPKQPNIIGQGYNDTLSEYIGNSLRVSNPEILKQFDYLALSIHGEFVIWPGGYETIKTVAILTLPEEKKNTMEKLTKEQYCEHCGSEIIEARFTAPTVKHRFCSTKCTEDFFEYKRKAFEEGEWTASDSVAAPKITPERAKEVEYEKALNFYLDNDINYTANTIKNADIDDLRQLASDSFHAGYIFTSYQISKQEVAFREKIKIQFEEIKQLNELMGKNQNALWIEAIKQFNKKENTQDGRDLLMHNFIIIQKASLSAKTEKENNVLG